MSHSVPYCKISVYIPMNSTKNLNIRPKSRVLPRVAQLLSSQHAITFQGLERETSFEDFWISGKQRTKETLKFFLSSPFSQHFFRKYPKFCKILLVLYVQDRYFWSKITHFQPLISGLCLSAVLVNNPNNLVDKDFLLVFTKFSEKFPF